MLWCNAAAKTKLLADGEVSSQEASVTASSYLSRQGEWRLLHLTLTSLCQKMKELSEFSLPDVRCGDPRLGEGCVVPW